MTRRGNRAGGATKDAGRAPAPVATIALGDAAELLDALSPRHPRWAGAPLHWLFRGHSDARWQLLPSTLRDRRQRTALDTAGGVEAGSESGAMRGSRASPLQP